MKWWETALDYVSSYNGLVSSLSSFSHFSAKGKFTSNSGQSNLSLEEDSSDASSEHVFEDESFLRAIEVGKSDIRPLGPRLKSSGLFPFSCKTNDPSVYVVKQNYLMESLKETKCVMQAMVDFNKTRWSIKLPSKKYLGKSPEPCKILNFTSIQQHGTGYDEVDLSLNDDFVSNVVELKLSEVIEHIDRLKSRLSDTTSKILVTGDVNAGKSTFVNSLLKKTILPSDQQPCTLTFCEVISSKSNMGNEEIHVVKEGSLYKVHDSKSFVRMPLKDLERSVTSDDCENSVVKIYCRSSEGPSSILHNEAVDITLIDSPGLNCDSFKTMSLYAKQEDIDVVIFVINAANHLTLSAQEFLSNVAKEKSFVFIVVNRFDDIRDKERCKSKIMNQIRSILPQTFENSNDLVHFVSSKLYLEGLANGFDMSLDKDFAHLEKSLSEFTLEKRAKSKLSPARTFVINLLNDIEIICDFNLKISGDEAVECSDKLSQLIPRYEELHCKQSAFAKATERFLKDVNERISSLNESVMLEYLNRLEIIVLEIPWHGPLDFYNYSREASIYLASVGLGKIKYCRNMSRKITDSCLSELVNMAKLESSSASNAPVLSTVKFPPVDEMEHLEEMEFTLVDVFTSLLTFDSIPSLLGITSALTAVFSQYKLLSLPFVLKIPTKYVLLSGGILGLGSIYFLTFNLQKKISLRLCGKIRRYYEISGAIPRQSNILSQCCQRSIRVTAWDLQKQFVSEINSSKKLISDLKMKEEVALDNERFFKELSSHVTKLKENVSSVEL